jgi:hypothetical protein
MPAPSYFNLDLTDPAAPALGEAGPEKTLTNDLISPLTVAMTNTATATTQYFHGGTARLGMAVVALGSYMFGSTRAAAAVKSGKPPLFGQVYF